jgi:SAM-dependent methyltransferase
VLDSDQPRPAVVALVPRDAVNVLDVGCAAGGLGRELKRQCPQVKVRGIEPVAAEAERARAFLDDVLVGTFETPVPKEWPAPDCIIFADVLEHLVDPWAAVARAHALLRPGGTLVASIPNVAHGTVVAGLLRGRFDYQTSGILDRTHLRFFTRPTAIALVESGGFHVHEVRRRLGYHTDVFDQRRLGGGLARLLDRETTPARRFLGPLATAADLLTCQFLIVATRAPTITANAAKAEDHRVRRGPEADR